MASALEAMLIRLMEHLEKSTPLIIEEMHRWREIIWDDYLERRI